MSRYIKISDWQPIDINDLEPNAFKVVKSNKNQYVIAGPGAGKTELLAQKACFLLQTGMCPSPKKILAISFKKDSAKNLKNRVAERCKNEDAVRFDSLTFDAFSKSLLDRFLSALPEHWRPSNDYQLLFPTHRTFDNFIEQLERSQTDMQLQQEIEAINRNTFEKNGILGSKLPPGQIEVNNVISFAADKWWKGYLHSTTQSQLSFPMIGRLVELLLRVNPLLLKALRLTYSHVFLDEFQDTTHVQYDLVHTSFLGSNSVLTAVGDNKQQIMRWAMALNNPFEKFQKDFGAEFIPLYRNYRSVPELVRIQHNIALTLDNVSKPSKSVKANTKNGEVCAILNYVTPEREAVSIALYVKKKINEEGLIPRDFGILVKQLAHEYESHLESAFRSQGIKCRNEAGKRNETGMQDILSERITKIILLFLRLGTMKRGGRVWRECSDFLIRISGYSVDDIKSGLYIDADLQKFYISLKRLMSDFFDDTESHVKKVIGLIIEYIGTDGIKQNYPEYSQGEWFQQILELICKNLTHSLIKTCDWQIALDDFEGLDSVPIMTIHKSKGLEFNTVFLVGLDDSAWWSFKNQPEEARSTFFVAFSRAKQRIFFTYCQKRGGSKRDIQSLYNVLKEAGVKTYTVN